MRSVCDAGRLNLVSASGNWRQVLGRLHTCIRNIPFETAVVPCGYKCNRQQSALTTVRSYGGRPSLLMLP